MPRTDSLFDVLTDAHTPGAKPTRHRYARVDPALRCPAPPPASPCPTRALPHVRLTLHHTRRGSLRRGVFGLLSHRLSEQIRRNRKLYIKVCEAKDLPKRSSGLCKMMRTPATPSHRP